MSSGFDDWTYWHFFTITINYDSSQTMTIYDSLHSLLDYKCLLQRMTNDKSLLTHWTPAECSIKKILWMNHNSFITSRQSEYKSPCQNGSLILLLFVLSIGMKRSSLLLSNRGPTVDCVTSRICLLKRCLAMDYYGFQASRQNIDICYILACSSIHKNLIM
jgi:hypothetical protein